MSDEEIERRILTAFAAGEASLCRCEACGAKKTDTYRPTEEPEADVKTYYEECAEELSEYLISSEEYHQMMNPSR